MNIGQVLPYLVTIKIFLKYYTGNGTSLKKRRTIQNILLDLEFFITDMSP
jgi:hypothetical protein